MSLEQRRIRLLTEHNSDGTHSTITSATIGTANLTTINKTGTGVVTNLNADLLDGLNTATASTVSTVAARDSSGNLTAKQLISDIADGTAPAVVTSTTVVSNFNSDTVDGYHGTDLVNPIVQSVITGSRAFGTVYQNTSGKPMYVRVSGYNGSAGVSLTAYTDSSNPPTTVVEQTEQPAGYRGSVGFWVLPGNYYKVDYSSGAKTLSYWVEWY